MYFLSIAVTVFSPDEVLVTYVNNMMMPRLGRQMNMMEAYTIGQGPDLENSIVMPFVVKINPNAILVHTSSVLGDIFTTNGAVPKVA